MIATFRQFLRSPLRDVPDADRAEFLRHLTVVNLTRARLSTAALVLVLLLALLLIDLLNLPRLTREQLIRAAPSHVLCLVVSLVLLTVESRFRATQPEEVGPTQNWLVLGFVFGYAFQFGLIFYFSLLYRGTNAFYLMYLFLLPVVFSFPGKATTLLYAANYAFYVTVVRLVELDPERQVTQLVSGSIAFLLALANARLVFGMHVRDFLTGKELAREHQRTERLLLNVLPPAIADRLKAGETRIADAFPSASILFADLVGFTTLSTRMRPAELVELLNEVFTAFDALAERHGVEKIKTIGDAYMAVCGVPMPNPEHARCLANLALDMRHELTRINAHRGTDLRIRIGLHSGEVVAGIIGTRKFSYDLWGDAVNTASRMESHGEPGKIQVSSAARQLLGDGYTFESTRRVVIKGKGEMDVSFLIGTASAGG